MSSLGSKTESIIYTVLGLAIGILVFVSLLPTIDSAFTDLIGNISSSSNFADFESFAEILPMLFIISMILMFIVLALKAKNAND